MKKLLFLLLLLLPASLFARTRSEDSAWVLQHYTKKEVMVPMRDGIKLFTTVYIPSDKKEKHPILMLRTPYTCSPYGEEFRPMWNMHWIKYLRENYIIVLQDVRGKWMSEGDYVDIRPYIEHKKSKKDIDEASDTYDTIDWLLANIPGNNGRVGVFGSSYPGFYTTMASVCGHPALKATSPQAPVTDWFAGDDFHHNGAMMEMDFFSFYSAFGKPRPFPKRPPNTGFKYYTDDNYKFYLETGSLANLYKLMGDSIQFAKDFFAHPDYDSWWQARNARNCVGHIPNGTATLVVGGLYDAEDCFGAWNLYHAINAKTFNHNYLVIGPWSHGEWYKDLNPYLGNIRFGSVTEQFYQDSIEVPYFNYYLKQKGSIEHIAKANVFFSGANEWRKYKQWPPAGKANKILYLQDNGSLSFTKKTGSINADNYVSDPSKPVPYAEGVHMDRTKEYMTDDQRFAARRPDVLVYETAVLDEDLTLAGPVIADLYTSITTTDADFIVKIIDVFPDDFKYDDAKDGKGNGKNYPMGAYQMLVRGEVMRGRYRNSLEHPEAFVPGKISEVKYKLPDIAHVFKKGHKLMVQIQSTWFPLVDRNPQQFVNIYTAKDEDFVKSTISIYHDNEHPSQIILPVLGKE